MKKIVIRIGILAAVFVAGVVLFSNMMNQGATETTVEDKDPTLPYVCIDWNGNKINSMYGYTQEMDATYVRDGIVPLQTDRAITVSINPYDSKIKNVTYELSTADGREVVENAQISGFHKDGDYQTVTFSLQTGIRMNQEYSLKLTVTADGRDIYYYTRVLQRASMSVDQYVDFAYSFYENCLNKEGSTGINSYLESSQDAPTTNYANIDIHSSYDQVTWGSLGAKIARRPIARIDDINETTGSITMEYMISCAGDDGATETYQVRDFYRMRYYQSKILLLDFYRTAEKICDGNATIASTGINLGVAQKSVQYMTNQNADIAGYVQTGDLWLYNCSTDKLTKVFSQMNSKGDERGFNTDYGIKIVRIAENGDMDFVVYGYRTSGEREGKNGISVYKYHADSGYLEERVFISSTKSSEYLAMDLDKLVYINGSGQMYFYLEGGLYQVDLMTAVYTQLQEGINPDCFMSSSDDSEAAWMNEMQPNASSSITYYSFESGTSRTITADAGTKVKAIGFINQDFIYGTADDSDIVTDGLGNTVFAMKHVIIADFDGTIIKDYTADDTRVSDVSIKDGLIELTRVTRDANGAFIAASTDNIMNNAQKSENSVSVRSVNNDTKGMQIILTFTRSIKSLSPMVATAKQLLSKTLLIKMEGTQTTPMNLFYVYAFGRLQEIVTEPNKAIQDADEMVGVVMNQRQQYVWERGNLETENEMTNDAIPAAVLTGTLDIASLAEQLGESAQVMDLSGCTLDQVLYEVSHGRAVIARKADGTSEIIVGYNEYNTRLYNFETGEHYYYGINDSRALFEAGGNIFISYVEDYKPTQQS